MRRLWLLAILIPGFIAGCATDQPLVVEEPETEVAVVEEEEPVEEPEPEPESEPPSVKKRQRSLWDF